MDCLGFDAALGVCRARRAGPLRDMRRFCGGFLAVPGRGTGIPERTLPYRSGAGCTVDRRRSAIRDERARNVSVTDASCDKPCEF